MAFVHHVNLGIPVGMVDAESEWLVDVVGFSPLQGPPNSHWFHFGDGAQIHLSEDAEHRPAARGHVAIEMPDLASPQAAIEHRHESFRTSESDGVRFLFCADPAGNKWELRCPA